VNSDETSKDIQEVHNHLLREVLLRSKSSVTEKKALVQRLSLITPNTHLNRISHQYYQPTIQHKTGYNTMPKEYKEPTMEYFRMLKAKRKRSREEQESMDVDAVTHPSSSQSPRPTKRACADNARILKEEDHIPANTCIPTEVSKLEPPAVKRPPARYVDFGAAELTSNASGGFGQEGQDYKEEEIARRCYRDSSEKLKEGHRQLLVAFLRQEMTHKYPQQG